MQSKFRQYRALRFLYALAALVLFAALVSACGGDSSNDTTGASEPTETNEATAEGGGEAAGGDVSGKKIGYLDVAATAPIQIRFQNAFKEAADALGWEVELQDVAGEQGKAVAAARSLINNGVDAIVASSTPAEWLQPIVAEAKSKEVPMMVIITKQSPGVYDGQVLEAQEPTSVKIAETVMEDFPNGGEVALMFEEEIPSLVERIEFLKEAFDGTNIKVVASQNVPIAENAKAQKYTQDILNAHPNLSAFIATSDIQSPEILAGLRTAGNSKVKLYGWYADTANVEQLQVNPKQFVGVVDSDIAKVCWIAAGELASFFTGGTIKELQEPEYEPLMIGPNDLTPAMEKEEGPVPFSEIGAPFYEEWETKFGITAP